MIVSIIVPIYKGKQYLKTITEMCCKNLQTITNEGANTNLKLEIVIVNDYTGDILSIEDFNKDDVKGLYDVVCVNNERNMGIHASRAIGVQKSHGEYIIMLDQDDKISDDYIVSQTANLMKNRADMVVANGQVQYENGGREIYRWGIMQQTVRIPFFHTLFNCRIVSPGQCMIRKDAIPAGWLRNYIIKNGADDFMLWLTMFSAKRKISINRKKIYTHCHTGNNVSLDKEGMNESILEIVKVARENRTVKEKYLRQLEKRIDYESGKSSNLFFKIIGCIIKAGEKINTQR